MGRAVTGHRPPAAQAQVAGSPVGRSEVGRDLTPGRELSELIAGLYVCCTLVSDRDIPGICFALII